MAIGTSQAFRTQNFRLLGNFYDKDNWVGKKGYALSSDENGVHWEADQNETSGIFSGGIMTATIGGTTFNVSAGVGQVVSRTLDIPTGEVKTNTTRVSWNTQSNIALTYRTTHPFSYIYIDENGAVQQQNSSFTDAEYKNKIILGTICHIDLATINLVTNKQNITYGDSHRLYELISTFGPIKRNGLAVSAYTTNLRLKRESGVAFLIGSNYTTDQFEPDSISLNSANPASLCRVYKNGTGGFVFDTNGGSFYTDVDPNKYDNGSGTLQTVNNNQWTIQRLFFFPNNPNDIIAYYGVGIYNSYGDAVTAMATESFSEATITAENAVFLAYLVVRGGATDLSLVSDGKFFQSGAFRNIGAIGGGGGGAGAIILDDLTDVAVTTPLDGQFLAYDGGTSLWKNSTLNAVNPLVFNGIGTSLTLSLNYATASQPGGVSTSAQTFGGTKTFANDVIVSGNFTVNGTTTTIDAQTLVVEDKNIELGVVASPTDLTADGGGITLRGTTDKTFNWIDATDSWTSSEHLDLASGKAYKINGTNVLTSTTLGSGVINSSLQNVGVLTNLTVAGYAHLATTSGNVGIGTTITNAKLDVSGLIRTNVGFSAIGAWSGAGSVYGAALDYDNGNNRFLSNKNGSYGTFEWLAGNDGSFTSRMFLNSSGNLSVGTAFSSLKLNVGGSIFMAAGNGTAISWSNDISSQFLKYDSSIDGMILSSWDHTTFHTRQTERMRITSTGNVGIGTTNPSQFLEVRRTTGSAIALLNYNDTVKLNINASSGGAGYIGMVSNHPLILVTNDTEKVKIGTNGNVCIGNADANNKLSVLGSASVGSNYNVAAPTNGLIVEGDMGVGITTPTSQANYRFLQVNGTNSAVIETMVGGARIGGFDSSSSVLYVGTIGAFPLVFRTEVTERWRITNAGILQSNGAQTIQTSTGTLTLATAAGNGHIVLTPNGTGNVGVNTTNPATRLEVADSNIATDSIGNLFVRTTNNQGINIGGQISLGGYYSASNIYTFGSIAGRKENATSGNVAGYLALSTTTSGGTNTERVRVNSEGNVGIGTVTPTGGLHINNAPGTFSEVLRLQRNGGVFYSVGLDTNFLNIAYNGNTNASNIFVLKTNGFLGLGNLQTANYNLDIASTQGQGIQLRFDTTTNYLARITPYWNSNTDSRIDFAINRSGGVTPDVIMSVGYGGNVGIGTTAPSKTLDVKGAGGVLNLQSTSNDVWQTFAPQTGNVWRLQAQTGNTFGIYDEAASAFRLLINSNGNVGIGSASANNKLYVSGSASIGSNYNIAGPTNGLIVEGNVGIGTSTVSTKLHISGGTYISNIVGTGDLRIENTDTVGVGISLKNHTGKYWFMYNGGSSSWAGDGVLGFVYTDGVNAATAPKVVFKSDGNVGIGTNNPNATLQIAGTSTGILTVGTLTNNWGGVVAIGVTNGNGVILSKVNTSNDTNRVLVLMRDDTNGAKIEGYTSGGASTDVGFLIRAGASSYFNGGNVGIGTANPGAKLEVIAANTFASIRSNASNAFTYLSIGRTASDFEVGVSGGSNQFFTGTAAGDGVIKAGTGKIHLGFGAAAPSITIDTSNNVGIGTTNPISKLDVRGQTYINNGLGTGSGQALIVAGSGDVQLSDGGSLFFGAYSYGSSTYIRGYDDLDIMYFYSNGTNIMNVRSTGVGIGTANPSNKLTITNNSDQLRLETLSSPTSFYSIISARYDSSHPFGIYVANNSVSTAEYMGVYADAGGSNNRVSFPTGSVGIGTTAPSQKFEVVGGEIKAGRIDTGSEGGQVSFGRSTDNNTAWYIDVYGSTSTPTLRFIDVSAASIRMTINESGNVGIGVASGTNLLDVNGTARIRSISASASTATIFLTTDANGVLVSRTAAQVKTDIGATGTINSVTATAPIASSGGVNPNISLNDAGVTYAKIQNVAVSSVLGNSSASVAQAPQELSMSTLAGMLSNSTMNINGTATNATNVAITTDDSTNSSYYLYFGANASGNTPLKASTKIRYNPSTGAFSATTKSFRIPHPTKPEHDLVYGSLESPYHGIRLTGKGKTNGTCAEIILPDYVNTLVDENTVNIQITAYKCAKVFYVENINIKDNKFVVKYDKSWYEKAKDVEFFWDFTAERKDVPKLIVEEKL